jgi:hypothetical protein
MKDTPQCPAKRALAVLDQPATAAADLGTPKRISKKVRAAIDAMVTGGLLATAREAPVCSPI